MNSIRAPFADRASLWLLAAVGLPLAAVCSHAQVQHLSITQPGGMPGLPVVTGIHVTNNAVTVTWEGPSGYYQLFEKSSLNGTWQALGKATNLTRTATVAEVASNAFFKVSGPAPQYTSATACTECHQTIHDQWQSTPHAGAFADAAYFGPTNTTVGFGLPTGFVSQSQTPLLVGVQCENCHGPAGNHAANPDDFSAVPRVEIAATVCGGCHTGPKQPNYDEWKTTEHATVTEPGLDPNSCGRCHMGAIRIAMVKKATVPLTDTTLAVECAVCHDPHRQLVYTNSLNGLVKFTNSLTGGSITITNNLLGLTYTNQVRNPLASTKDYFLTTSDVFSNKYDPAINVCAQCHNHRGAAYTSASRAPHHSPQYNILIGTVGQLSSGAVPNFPATHSRLELQCVACHMQTANHQNGPPEVAAITGHSFQVNSFQVCAGCHQSASNAQNLVDVVQQIVAEEIQTIKAGLDLWAVTKAPPALAKYSALAWEYTTPGDLAPSGSVGPTAAEQALIPVNIQKARFNLYLVLYDGSYGVHNAPYASTLLDAAYNWVQTELQK
jgi:hypothetical protein